MVSHAYHLSFTVEFYIEGVNPSMSFTVLIANTITYFVISTASKYKICNDFYNFISFITKILHIEALL